MRMRWPCLALGFVAAFLAFAGPASAQRRDTSKGIICSGPTRFHCAVFGAGFTKFYKAFKGWRPPDREVAADYCEARNLSLLSARLRPWPGGPGNEVFVVDVRCTARPVARSVPAGPSEPLPRRSRAEPPAPGIEVLDDDEPRTRRRPAARRSAEPTRERSARSSDEDAAPPRGRVGRIEREAPPARERSRARAEPPEVARTPEPVRPPEPSRTPANAVADTPPAPEKADPKPEPSAAPPAERPKPSRRKPSSYEESLTYEHF